MKHTTTITDPMLSVKNVSKNYGGLVAVDDVSFDISGEEIVSIIGPNGAGKTTLFNVINGFLDPSGGEVRLSGTDVTHAAPHTHAKHGMARTFQLVKPFEDMTVRENVMVGSFYNTRSREQATNNADAVLEEVDMIDIADEEVSTLSVKDKKRMELGRALATDPEILLVDEIMAGLNDTELEEILALLREVNEEGRSIIIIEHIMKAVMDISDRIIVLSDGQKIATGPPDAVADNDQVIEIYLGKGWKDDGGKADA